MRVNLVLIWPLWWGEPPAYESPRHPRNPRLSTIVSVLSEPSVANPYISKNLLDGEQSGEYNADLTWKLA